MATVQLSRLPPLTMRTDHGVVYYEFFRKVNPREVAKAIINDAQEYEYPYAYGCVDLMTNSVKYGDELQFKAFSYRPPILQSRNNPNRGPEYRNEAIYLPVNAYTSRELRMWADYIDLYRATGQLPVRR